MSEHNHTGLDEAVSVASNTLQAVRTGKAISAAAKGAAAGGPYGAAIGAALSARTHIGKAVAERPEQPGSRSSTTTRPLRKI